MLKISEPLPDNEEALAQKLPKVLVTAKTKKAHDTACDKWDLQLWRDGMTAPQRLRIFLRAGYLTGQASKA